MDRTGKVTLKGMRVSRGLKVHEVAEKIGVSTDTIYSYEKGNTEPRTATLNKLLDLYGFSYTQLTLKVPEEGKKFALK